MKENPKRQPTDPGEINIVQPTRGRPFDLAPSTEDLFKEAIDHYAAKNTPLSINEIRYLVEHYLEIDQNAAIRSKFKNFCRSSTWTRIFLARNGFEC